MEHPPRHGHDMDPEKRKEMRKKFAQKMQERETEFFKTYQKNAAASQTQQSVADLMAKQLNELSNANRAKLQEICPPYKDSDLVENFDSIPGESVLFNPELRGLAKIYTLTSQEAISEYHTRADFIHSIHEHKPYEESFQKRNFQNELEVQLKYCKKRVSTDQFVIDVTSQGGYNLLLTIAEFFEAGINAPAISIFKDLLELPTDNVNLQSAIIYSNSNNNYSSNLQYLLRFVYVMLNNLQCANLIRTMSSNDSFLKSNYFFDAPLRDPLISDLVARTVEEIECYEITGNLDINKAPKISPPVSGDIFARRVEETIDQYLNLLRKLLLRDNNMGIGQFKEKHLQSIVTIFNLFATTFLMQENGELASYNALWDVFKNIADIQDPTSRRSFETFQKILKKKDVLIEFKDGKKAWAAIVEIYNAKIMPDVVSWAAKAKPVRAIKNPVYTSKIDICTKIADAFEAMHYPSIQVEYSDIKKIIFDD